jgi:hypothetical protein
MPHANSRDFALRCAVAVFAGSLLGGFLGLASAQQDSSGWLNADCAGRCTTAGYDCEFCQSVCWVPDPAKAAEIEGLDWQCFEGCAQRGGKARACVASCRR